MTKIVIKDMEWLREQVKEGVEGYLQIHSAQLASRASDVVMAQVLQSCCCERADSRGEEEAEIRIRIEVPAPSECPDEFYRIGEALFRERD